MINYKAIAAHTFVISAALATAILLPIFIEKDSALESGVTPSPELRESNRDRFYLEQHLVSLGKEPLSWSCQESSPDQIRYIRNACFGEHIVEIDFGKDGSEATVKLFAYEKAIFKTAAGNATNNMFTLKALIAQQLRGVITNGFTDLPSYSPGWQLPAYRSAIESCIGGQSHMVARNLSGDSEFESRASSIVRLSGIELAFSEPLHCM